MNVSIVSRIIIVVSSVLIVALFFLSIDRYKSSYKQWRGQLDALKLASQEYDGALLKSRTDLVDDFDELTEKEVSLKNLYASLNALKSDLSLKKSSMGERITEALNNQKNIVLPQEYIENLAILVTQRIDFSNKFKSHYSIFKNSKSIVFQLINEIRDKFSSESELVESFDRLENFILHNIRFEEQVYLDQFYHQINFIKERYSGKEFKEIQVVVDFILRHFDLLVLNEKLVDEILQDNVEVSVNFVENIDAINIQLDAFNENNSLERARYFYSFLLVSIFVLLFGIFHARRSATLTKKLMAHNEDLEIVVGQRTEHLELAKNDLLEEVNQRKEIMLALAESKRKIDSLVNNIHGCVYEYDIASKKINYVSKGVMDIWGISMNEARSACILWSAMHPEDNEHYQLKIQSLVDGMAVNYEYRVIRSDGEMRWVREISSPIFVRGEIQSIVNVAVDISEFKKAGEDKERIEKELASAQKLESVGQLAAGVAHEINTPAQFISDNLLFLQESVNELLDLIKNIREKIDATQDDDLIGDVNVLLDEADVDYLIEEVPPALNQSYDGISRVAKIVKAMKDYSHPGDSMCCSDINEALESTIIVSSTEWKYFANLEMEFSENLPLVECVVGDINQVVLNMIVNSAHSIVEKYDDPDNLEGKIVVRTLVVENYVHIEVSDNGKGIPDSVKHKIFDQFFTTKEVGRGTGQGLSIAYRLIVEGHHGKIEVDSEEGAGTTFRIILPIEQKDSPNGQEKEVA